MYLTQTGVMGAGSLLKQRRRDPGNKATIDHGLYVV